MLLYKKEIIPNPSHNPNPIEEFIKKAPKTNAKIDNKYLTALNKFGQINLVV